MIAMVSCVSGMSQGKVTISALTSSRSIMASALASQNALYTLVGSQGYCWTSSLRMPTRCMIGNMWVDVRLAAQERRRRARREQGVELAVAQHADESLLLADRLQVEPGNRL